MNASSTKIIPHIAELWLSFKETDACYVVLLSGVCRKTLVRDFWQNMFSLALGSVCKVSVHSQQLLSLRTTMCSSVVIGTRHAMKDPRIESPLGRVFRTHPDRPCGPPSLLYNGSRFIFGVKSGRGVVFTTHPCLYIEVKETVQLYLYSPSVPAWHVRGWKLRYGDWRIKPTRCHLLFYCTSYRLNMFRALLCPSSGARYYNVDYHIGRFVLGLL